jgi:hypothetical protein
MDFVWSRERSRFPDDFYGGTIFPELVFTGLERTNL